MLRECIASESEILEAAAQATPVRRPANGDEAALADFEEALGELLVRALTQRVGSAP